ncbi:MAG: ATP-binding protein [bacterium]
MRKRKQTMFNGRLAKNDGNVSGHPLHCTMLTYARNVLGAVELDEKSLTFILSPLSEAGREALLSFVLCGFSDEEAAKKAEGIVGALDRHDESEIAEWILDSIGTPVNGLKASALEECLRDLLGRDIAAEDAAGAGSLVPGMDDVRRLFRLTDDDVELLTATLCYRQFGPMEQLCDSFRVPEKFGLLSVMTGVPAHRIRASGSRGGRLVRCGLTEYPDFSNRGAFYNVNPAISEHLLGLRSEPLGSTFHRRGDAGAYLPEAFSLPGRSVEILRSLLSSERPCSVLLYGEPGTGKTEFAKAIASACGKASCFVLTGETGENKDRRTALMASVTTFAPADAIVVVDEADALLNSRYAFMGMGGNGALRKEWLNEFLDDCQAQVIWITNDTSCIEESTRRRFAYAVEFKGYSARQREQVWQAHLKGHPLQAAISPGMVSELSREYQVNAAGIASALAAARQVVRDTEARPETVRETLRDILASHEKLTGHERHGKLASLTAAYDPDAVNASEKPEALVRALEPFAGADSRSGRLPANLLFWGAPGTGKTAFAQYLAQSLGLELLVKRASDLLNMFVGGTEQNIRDAFDTAERENAILFLDEADSFFIDRKTAAHSWESSQTNELLTQMENHHGILVCCTNLLEDLDHAAMRRFAWKVRFMPLTDEGKVRLYKKYFPDPAGDLSGAMQGRLERIADLTPGDIKAVWQRHRLQAGLESDHGLIVAALEEEAAYKNHGRKQVGFR